ncbi:hypothetical protein Agub_g1802 [Astrephomene gubernaculifera]|uniref:ATP-dependent RNA helicase n=1 Tax=Astrephomene gubernaculifera TaxID=47775 RepID=A0AAD3HHQ8_9CHLO|nr:hypothetical protein Agub_g1802 [Astrephomene gubernaculifera]
MQQVLRVHARTHQVQTYVGSNPASSLLTPILRASTSRCFGGNIALASAAHSVPGNVHGFSTTRTRINKAPRLTGSLVQPKALASGTEAFFSTEHDNFSSMGFSPEMQQALEVAGFTKPSKVQELAAPHVLRGRNVVIAAETGSGKTLSYVLPIAHLMLKQRLALQPKQEGEGDDAGATGRSRQRRYHALVLCPNTTLCQQVVAAVKCLRGPDGEPLVTAAHVNSSNPPPFEAPDVIVATPAGLQTILNDSGGAYGWLWSEDGMQARVRHVILDEADLLLGNAYSKATQSLLVLFKTGDRRRVEARVFEELGIADKSEFDRLPRPIQQAAWQGGVPAMLAAGYKPKRALDPEAKYGPYWRRQYIYSAATMPTITYSDVGSQIQKMHPDAVWVSTELLHQSKPHLEHKWQEVSDETFGPVVLEAVRSDPDYQARSGKTLVFAADGASADAVSEVLAGGHVPHVVYHKSRNMADQAAAMETLRSQDGAVMVCTDAAARGLDVQGITHVVQADFAANAIDFIHRIGRTARAGRSGRVTSLYRARNSALVDVLRDYIKEGVPLEAAFSRARSFSKKLKKTGGVFVPRGVSVAGSQASEQGTRAAEEGTTAREGGDSKAEEKEVEHAGVGAGR